VIFRVSFTFSCQAYVYSNEKKLLVIAVDCLFLNSFNSKKKKENVKLSAFFAEHNLPLSALLNLAVFYPGAAFFIFSVAVSTNFFVQVYKLFSPKKNYSEAS